MVKKTVFAVALMLVTQAWAAHETYKIDETHSFANFSIRHVVSKTTGTFNAVRGEITLDTSNLNTAKVNAIININSVNTGLAKRDEHIKAEKYLNLAQYMQMTFESVSVVASSQTQGVKKGKLTLHGVTRLIEIPFEVLGYGPDPWGGQRAGFEGKTHIKASDYGFTWAAAPNAPVGDDIEITLLIEGVKVK